MLGQIETAIETTEKVLAGRTETLVVTFVLVIFIGFVLWRDWRIRLGDRRDAKDQQKREDARDQADRDRADKQLAFYQQSAERTAGQFDTIATALDRTSKATETMAASAERTEQSLARLADQQIIDRRAIIEVIDATEANNRGESDRAADAFRRARDHLINDRT